MELPGVWGKGGLSGESSWLPVQEGGSAPNQNLRNLRYHSEPPSHFISRNWGLQSFSNLPKIPAHQWCVSTFCLTNDLSYNPSRCCSRTGFVSQTTDMSFLINTTSLLPHGHSLFGNSPFPKAPEVSHWKNGLILILIWMLQVFFLLFICNHGHPAEYMMKYLRITFRQMQCIVHWYCWSGTHLGHCVIYLVKCFWRLRTHW